MQTCICKITTDKKVFKSCYLLGIQLFMQAKKEIKYNSGTIVGGLKAKTSHLPGNASRRLLKIQAKKFGDRNEPKPGVVTLVYRDLAFSKYCT